MKQIKYLLIIIIVAILVFVGIEIFRKAEHEENNTNEIKTENREDENKVEEKQPEVEEETVETDVKETEPVEEKDNNVDATENTNKTQKEEILNGEELLKNAEKTISARGWAGASQNVIGLKDGIIYYFNTETKEFYKIAEGIDDIYYETQYSEEIIAKKNSNFKQAKEAPNFLTYK